nr:hypothetical protein [Chlorokybus atmophyticus]
MKSALATVGLEIDIQARLSGGRGIRGIRLRDTKKGDLDLPNIPLKQKTNTQVESLYQRDPSICYREKLLYSAPSKGSNFKE